MERQKNDFMAMNKEGSTKMHSQTTELMEQNEQLAELLSQRDNKLDLAQSTIKDLEQELDQIRDKMQADHSVTESNFHIMEEENCELKNQIEQVKMQLQEEYDESLQNLKLEVAELKAHNDELVDSCSRQTKENEKEKAVLTQKIDFLQTRLDEAGEQSQGSLKHQEALLRAVKSAEDQRDQAMQDTEIKVEEI